MFTSNSDNSAKKINLNEALISQVEKLLVYLEAVHAELNQRKVQEDTKKIRSLDSNFFDNLQEFNETLLAQLAQLLELTPEEKNKLTRIKTQSTTTPGSRK